MREISLQWPGICVSIHNTSRNVTRAAIQNNIRIFVASLIQQLPLQNNRFWFEPELTAKIPRIPGPRLYNYLNKYRFSPSQVKSIKVCQEDISPIAKIS